MEGGGDVLEELLKDRDGGMPWMVVFGGNGEELVTSNDSNGNNVGCPVTPSEIEHFVEMINQSSDASEGELTAINEALTENAKKYQNP